MSLFTSEKAVPLGSVALGPPQEHRIRVLGACVGEGTPHLLVAAFCATRIWVWDLLRALSSAHHL